MGSGARFVLALIIALSCITSLLAGELPEIVSTPSNAVPSCVTPERLMQFVEERNLARTPPKQLDPRFAKVAFYYKTIGECVAKVSRKCVGVRWDYAFFQMLIETNYLLFTGAVHPTDNNFAGVGATVTGKPGERLIPTALSLDLCPLPGSD